MRRQNPILTGFHPDPSIVRAGDDYYIATSTFEWFPGITIHHSKDLVNWVQISSALTDEAAVDLTGIDTACGIWAPNLTYQQGIFYLVYTIVYTNRSRYKDTHNFLITTNDIRGQWSKPIPLNKSGFDPSLFHDDDGKKWLVNMTLDYRTEKQRFRGIDIQEYDSQKQKLKGPVYKIFSGSDKGSTEGPNLFKRGDYYYLVAAEGGTGINHCVTVCRSQTLNGPYEMCPSNPILTSSQNSAVTLKRAGHGQLLEDREGNWYMAHLCSRMIDQCSILGRESAIQNINWTEDGWFEIANNELQEPELYFNVSGEWQQSLPQQGYVDFAMGKIPLDYLTLRQSTQTCGIEINEGVLVIKGGNSLSSKYDQGFLARRQQHFSYDFTAAIDFLPRSHYHMAGISCYYNYDNYHYLRISQNDDGERIISATTVENREITDSQQVILPKQGVVYLKASVRIRVLQFYYSLDDQQYHPIGLALDMRILSDERVHGNGFTGAMVGVCCQDLMGDGVEAKFKWINYSAEILSNAGEKQ